MDKYFWEALHIDFEKTIYFYGTKVAKNQLHLMIYFENFFTQIWIVM